MVNKDFVLAGKSIFTADNGKGDWYTFKVKSKKANANFPETWFIYLMTGPSNEKDYTYLGLLEPFSGRVRLTQKSTFTDDSKPVKVLRWVFGIIWNNGELPQGYDVHHENRCGRCGRLLTVPESVLSGIGPECANRIAQGPIH